MRFETLFWAKGGTVVEVQIAENINPVMANYAKGVLNSLQGVLDNGEAYTAAESGIQGLYEAAYTAHLQPNGLASPKSLNQDSLQSFITKGMPRHAHGYQPELPAR
ncbi:MAG: hypothetical protein IPL28_20055 [Chloroflexi bacterium]|nr:hypothetical protein [Chloroflexota bacterium]